jgi:DNA/RNA endonuclease YhcR with UshA esterase domain
MVMPDVLDGSNVCITGLLTDYKGVAQIVMRDAGQLGLSQ